MNPLLVLNSGIGRASGPPPDSEPVLAQGDRLLWQDDFTDPNALASYTTLDGESGLSLDANQLRIDWLTRGGCIDDSHLIERGWANPPANICASWTVRYDPGFVFDWSEAEGCTGNAKKLFFLWGGATGRWMVICENGAIGSGSDFDHPLLAPNVGPAITPAELGNGQWHRFTFRVRQSTTDGALDGALEGWVDGTKRWAHEGIASRATGGWSLFKMPTTFNQSSPVNQSEWVDSLTLWVPEGLT